MRRGYYLQARSDWRMFLWLLESHVHGAYRLEVEECYVPELCHLLHYLQMATEKLGKALLLAEGGMSVEDATTTHAAFARYVDLVARNHTLANRMNLTVNRLAEMIEGIRPLARFIEQLAPAETTDGSNPEYPWPETSPSGHVTIRTPCNYDFDDLRELADPQNRLYRFIQAVLDSYNALTDITVSS